MFLCERQRKVLLGHKSQNIGMPFWKGRLEGLGRNKMKMNQRKINPGKGKMQDIRNSLIQINVLVMGFGNLMQVSWKNYKKTKISVKI